MSSSGIGGDGSPETTARLLIVTEHPVGAVGVTVRAPGEVALEVTE
jgi:hypothetical protein